MADRDLIVVWLNPSGADTDASTLGGVFTSRRRAERAIAASRELTHHAEVHLYEATLDEIEWDSGFVSEE